jgi:succinate dehydrogenase / fumarate reductase membrane anchor subunit
MAYVTDSKRVTGLGTAKSGTHHFWTMTVTAVALLRPDALFPRRSSARFWARTHEEVVASLSRPLAAMWSRLPRRGMHHFRLGVTTLDRGLRARARPQDLDHRDDHRQLRLAAAGLVALAQIAL